MLVVALIRKLAFFFVPLLPADAAAPGRIVSGGVLAEGDHVRHLRQGGTDDMGNLPMSRLARPLLARFVIKVSLGIPYAL